VETAADLIAKTEKRFRDAVRLARVVSIASRIEPELVRQARLQLLPAVDAGAEADLWFSPLVQASTPIALTLFPAVADLLRRELAKTPDVLRSAWELLKVAHRDAPAAIRLEERVTWETLSGGPAALQRVEEALMSVVSAINLQKRSGLARWALRAVPRLPEAARQTKAATTLILTAASHLKAWHLLEKQIEGNVLSADFINQLQIVLPPDLPKVRVGVRLLQEARETTMSEPRYLIEFSAPPSVGVKDQIEVPGTAPLMMEVSWGDPAKPEAKNVSLYQRRAETVAVGTRNTVTIRTAAGDIYTLSEDKEEAAPNPPAAVSPIAALDRIPSPPSIGFVPRRLKSGPEIVEKLTTELSRDVKRIVQIVGPAGMGKTTLAAEIARRLIDRYEQRVVWLSAAGRSDFSLNSLLDGIATQLSRSDMRTLDPESKTREVTSLLDEDIALVVLDDFEIISLKEQGRCFRFLKNHGRATVIVSPKTIGSSSVRDVFKLSAMSQDEGFEFLKRTINQAPRSSMFQDSDPFQRVFSVCEGNPLAMQLLLAQIEFVQDEANALDEMAKETGNSLNRVFNLSFNLPQLEDDGRSVLLATALFVPSASKEALAQVAPLEGDLERLNAATTQLIRLKLAREVAHGKRFGVEGFIRDSLEGRLSRTRTADFRYRFVSYFLSYAQRHSEPTATDYDALEAEFENLNDAMDMAEDHQSWNELIQICTALAEFFDVRGYWDEALRRNDQAQRAARKSGQKNYLPRLNQSAGDIYLKRRQFTKAEAAFRRMLRSHVNKPVNVDVAIAISRLGSVALQQEKLKLAESFYSKALEVSKQLNFQTGVTDNVHNLAIVKQEQGDLDGARRLYEESLKDSRSLNDDRSQAISLHQLGVIAMETGSYAEAAQFFQQSLAIKSELGDRSGMADTLHQLGLLFQAEGKNTEAEAALRDALGIFTQLGSPSAREVEEDLNTLLRARVSYKRRPSKAKSKKKRADRPTSKPAAAPSRSGKKPRPGSYRPGGGSRGRISRRSSAKSYR